MFRYIIDPKYIIYLAVAVIKSAQKHLPENMAVRARQQHATLECNINMYIVKLIVLNVLLNSGENMKRDKEFCV